MNEQLDSWHEVYCEKFGIILNIENNETTEMYNGLVGFLSENNYEVYKYEDIDKAKATKRIIILFTEIFL